MAFIKTALLLILKLLDLNAVKNEDESEKRIWVCCSQLSALFYLDIGFLSLQQCSEEMSGDVWLKCPGSPQDRPCKHSPPSSSYTQESISFNVLPPIITCAHSQKYVIDNHMYHPYINFGFQS